MTISVNDINFSEAISNGVSLVDFWAVWCGPCQVMIPRLDQLSEKIGNKAKIMKMNVDENPQTPQVFNIRGIPTMLIFKDGKLVGDPIVGIREVSELEAEILKHV